MTKVNNWAAKNDSINYTRINEELIILSEEKHFPLRLETNGVQKKN